MSLKCLKDIFVVPKTPLKSERVCKNAYKYKKELSIGKTYYSLNLKNYTS